MLSRFWLLLLALAVGGALSAAYLQQAAVERGRDGQLLEQLSRDHTETELWLRLEARARLDALAGLAAHPDVRQALRSEATRRRYRRSRVNRQLAALNRALKEGQADLLLLLNTTGDVVGALGAGPGKLETMGKMPLVAGALQGYILDDVWLYNGRAYRMAARPVIEAGRYVGAVVHGAELDRELAKRLSPRLNDATVAFFVGDKITALYDPSAEPVEESDLAAALKDKLKAGEVKVAGDAQATKIADGSAAVMAFVKGSAAHAKVGYVLYRHRMLSAGGPLSGVTKQDLADLPWGIVVGVPLLLAILGMLIFYMERDRPLRALLDASQALAEGTVMGVSTDNLRHRYRKIADSINQALRRHGALEDGPGSGLQQVLDAVVEETKSPQQSYFGFASEPPSEPPPARPPAPQKPPAPKPPTFPRPAMPSQTGRFDDSGATAIYQSEDALQEEESTMVAEIPQEVLDKFAGQYSNDGQDSAASFAEEQHFHEVYEQFVATLKECGERERTVDFEHFVGKLRATRDEMKSKHNARSVLFTVYVKDGRAALKANPLK